MRRGASSPPWRVAAPIRWELAEEKVGGRGKWEDGEDEQLDKLRDAVMSESQKAVDGIPLSQPSRFRREDSKGGLEPSQSRGGGEDTPRPCNLMLRRAAACNAPSAAPENGIRKAKNEGRSLTSPEKNSAAAKYSGRLRRLEVVLENEKRPRFSSVLSKDEIVEDLFLITWSKPPRRPRKRPRNVQKQIEVLCPSFYLTEITPDLYRTS